MSGDTLATDENFEATIISNDNSNSPTSHSLSSSSVLISHSDSNDAAAAAKNTATQVSSRLEDTTSENYQATSQKLEEFTEKKETTALETNSNGTRGVEGSKDESTKKNKSLVLHAALDVAVAGALLGWLMKRPEKRVLGILTASVFYGMHWFMYKRWSGDQSKEE